MPVDILISDEEIAFAERELLPEGKFFDEERRRFIRCLDTVDLQAVPGSGKTTVLLAKLLILDRRLPFSDGSGILVISHTNSAVNEIRSRIGMACAQIFSYPNFIGTIQSFVDRFLAIPFYISMYGRRPHKIDNDSYRVEAERFSQCFLKGYKKEEQNAAKYYLNMQKCCSSYRLSMQNGNLIPARAMCGTPLNIKKPRGADWTEEQKTRIASWLVDYKLKILEGGTLCYDDAYFLAELAASSSLKFQTLLSRRFRYVFVDEMQDMAPHQNYLLEKFFASEDSLETNLQRIGDTDQAIFGGKNITDTVGWQQRNEVLTLNNSLRLSFAVSKILAPFAFERGEEFVVNGLFESDLKPCLLIYDDDSVNKVIEKFAQLILRFQEDEKIPRGSEVLFKAIAWNSTWTEAPNPEERKLRLIDFYPNFQRSVSRKQEEFDTLADYLICINPDDATLASARKGVLRGIVMALRLEGILDPRTEKPFTPSSLFSFFRFERANEYESLKLFLYRCSVALVGKKLDYPLKRLRQLVPGLIDQFEKKCENSKQFVFSQPNEPRLNNSKAKNNANTMSFGDLDIHLATVHSAKGQTHTATLYIESAYYKDGTGAAAKSYESQRLADQFKGQRLSSNAPKRVKESARMVYVGFSRPTHLLAFAVHKDRFNAHLSELSEDVWEIIPL